MVPQHLGVGRGGDMSGQIGKGVFSMDPPFDP